MTSVQRLFEDALAALHRGDPLRAEGLFRKVLATQPGHVPSLNLLTVVLMSMERFSEAEAFIARAVALRPDSDASRYNYGLILKRLNKLDRALEQFDHALRIDARVADTWNNRGTIFNDLERYDAAIADFERAIALNPKHAGAFANKGNALLRLKRHAEAAAAYDQALALAPDLAEAWLGRGNVLCERERHEEAAAAYERALARRPDLAEAWLGRGKVLAGLERHAEAHAAYARAAALKPDLAEAWRGCGNALTELKRWDEALSAYDRALALDPGSAEARVGRGNLFSRLNRHDEALAAYGEALALEPELESAWLGRGNVLFALERAGEALACYDKAIALDAELAEAHLNKALLKLSLGDYEEGWRLYERRWLCGKYKPFARNFRQPLWLNDFDIRGKTLLVHAEQGFGDAIQFSRYLPFVVAKGGGITFESPAPLAALFRASIPGIRIIERGDAIPDFDCHCPLLSLPLAFATTVDTIPGRVPYLQAPADRLAVWRKRIRSTARAGNGPKIGLAWAGNPDFQNDRRSITLESLRGILRAGCEWYSLQKDVRDRDRGGLSDSGMNDLSGSLVDFADTAAAITEMDLVISVDTAVAHLAGALGKPVWILLPFSPDFRWLRGRADSPWYPSARLFSQASPGAWDDVLRSVADELGRVGDR